MTTILQQVEIDRLLLGQYGATFFNDTTARTGVWGAINHLTNVTYTTLTDDIAVDGSTFPGTVTFPAGSWLYGRFTAITLATGTAVAYKEE